MPTEQEPMTEEEAQAMREQLAVYEADQRAAALAARNAKLEPLRTIVNGEEYAAIHGSLRAMLPEFMGEEPLFPMIKALADIMPQLKIWAAK